MHHTCTRHSDSRRHRQNNTTCLRRFYYTLQSEEQYIVTREADAPVSGGMQPELLDTGKSDGLLNLTGTTGLRTWQAGIRMANHLLAHPDIVASKKVLEMGSGTGVLACLIDKIQVSRTDKTRRGGLIATDTDGNNGVLQALRDNLALSMCLSKRENCIHTLNTTIDSCDEVIVIPLDWTKPVTDSRFVDIDVVVATDVVSAMCKNRARQSGLSSISRYMTRQSYQTLYVACQVYCIKLAETGW